MRKLFNINNHKFSIENKSLIVDGVLLDIKLKSTMFNTSANPLDDKKWSLIIGKNEIIIEEDGFEVNGQKFSYDEIDELKKSVGIVKSSKKPYGYTFTDVEVVSGGQAKDYAMSTTKANPEKKRRFRLINNDDVTQVGETIVINNNSKPKPNDPKLDL